MTQYQQPPQTCRLTVFGTQLENDREILPTENLEWRGEVKIRYNPDLDNMLKLYSSDSFVWMDINMIEFLGRRDEAYSLSDIVSRDEMAQVSHLFK